MWPSANGDMAISIDKPCPTLPFFAGQATNGFTILGDASGTSGFVWGTKSQVCWLISFIQSFSLFLAITAEVYRSIPPFQTDPSTKFEIMWVLTIIYNNKPSPSHHHSWCLHHSQEVMAGLWYSNHHKIITSPASNLARQAMRETRGFSLSRKPFFWILKVEGPHGNVHRTTQNHHSEWVNHHYIHELFVCIYIYICIYIYMNSPAGMCTLSWNEFTLRPPLPLRIWLCRADRHWYHCWAFLAWNSPTQMERTSGSSIGMFQKQTEIWTGALLCKCDSCVPHNILRSAETFQGQPIQNDLEPFFSASLAGASGQFPAPGNFENLRHDQCSAWECSLGEHSGQNDSPHNLESPLWNAESSWIF